MRNFVVAVTILMLEKRPQLTKRKKQVKFILEIARRIAISGKQQQKEYTKEEFYFRTFFFVVYYFVSEKHLLLSAKITNPFVDVHQIKINWTILFFRNFVFPSFFFVAHVTNNNASVERLLRNR